MISLGTILDPLIFFFFDYMVRNSLTMVSMSTWSLGRCKGPVSPGSRYHSTPVTGSWPHGELGETGPYVVAQQQGQLNDGFLNYKVR